MYIQNYINNLFLGKFFKTPENLHMPIPTLIEIETPAEEINFHSIRRVSTARQYEPSQDIFVCENDGCTAVFSTHLEYNNHITMDNCELHLENSRTEMVQLYARKVQSSVIAPKVIEMESELTCSSTNVTLNMGWALKAGRKNTRFNDRQKLYLVEKFNHGLVGHKEDPENVSEAMKMKYATNDNGGRMFNSSEFLTPQQIMSFFSRHAKKNDAVRENTISELQRQVQ